MSESQVARPLTRAMYTAIKTAILHCGIDCLLHAEMSVDGVNALLDEYGMETEWVDLNEVFGVNVKLVKAKEGRSWFRLIAQPRRL